MPATRRESHPVNSVPCPRCGKTDYHFVHQDGTGLAHRLMYACCDSCGELWLYVAEAESA